MRRSITSVANLCVAGMTQCDGYFTAPDLVIHARHRLPLILLREWSRGCLDNRRPGAPVGWQDHWPLTNLPLRDTGGA